MDRDPTPSRRAWSPWPAACGDRLRPALRCRIYQGLKCDRVCRDIATSRCPPTQTPAPPTVDTDVTASGMGVTEVVTGPRAADDAGSGGRQQFDVLVLDVVQMHRDARPDRQHRLHRRHRMQPRHRRLIVPAPNRSPALHRPGRGGQHLLLFQASARCVATAVRSPTPRRRPTGHTKGVGESPSRTPASSQGTESAVRLHRPGHRPRWSPGRSTR